MLGGQQLNSSQIELDSQSETETEDNFEEDVEMLDLQQIMTIEQRETVIDADLEPEYQNLDYRELIQANSYDRAICTKGPVIKFFENPMDDDHENEFHRLKYQGHLKPIRGEDGLVCEP